VTTSCEPSPAHVPARDEPLEQLSRLLDECRQGRGAAAVLRAPSGFGKSTVLATLATLATGHGCTVLSAVGSQAESGFPYGILEQLFQDAAPAGHDLTALDTAGPEEGAAAAMQACHRALAALSADRPVVICVDDAQHADLLSLQCLLYLIRRCHRLPVLLVLACALPGTPQSRTLLTELACRPGVAQLRLGPLGLDQVASQVAGRFGPAASGRYAEEFLRASGGNHLLLQGLLSDLASHQAAGSGDGDSFAPGNMFREAAIACIRRSGADALAVARGIAVLDGSSSSGLLILLLEAGERTVLSAVELLTESRLLEGGRFRDPAIRAAVLDDIPAAGRLSLHRRAGGLLRQEGAPALAVAPHLLAVGPVTDEWAARLLVEASEQASAGGQPELAIRCLQLAENCTVDEEWRHRIRMSLAQMMWRDRPEASTRMLLTLAEPAKAGQLPGVTSLQVARGLLMRGQVDDAIKISEQLDTRPDQGDHQLALELSIARLWLTSTYPGASRRREESPATPQPVLPGVSTHPGGMLRLSANHALWKVVTRGADEALLAKVERTLQSVPAGDASVDVLVPALMALVYADRLKTAGSWCDRFLATAEEGATASWVTQLTAAGALIALRQGNLRRAARMAETALASMPRAAWGVEIGMPLAILIEARTAMGDHAGAIEAVHHPVPEALFQTRFGLHYLYARGRHHLATGFHDSALADFRVCGEKARSWNMDSPMLVPWRAGEAEVRLRAGQRDQAAKLADEHLGLTKRTHRRTRGVALRLQGATRDPAQRLELLQAALEFLEPAGDQYEVALTLADLGRVHQHYGDTTKARLLVRQAWHLARECGAEALCSALVPKPAEGGKSPQAAGRTRPGTGVTSLLSEAEMRVTSLAARGYTNREISGKLFITVSTVEQHLSRVYRKLNIRHRQELPTSFAS